MENYAVSKMMESQMRLNEAGLSKKVKNIKNSEDEKLKKACQDFEGIMLHQILKTMRKTVPEGGILPKSQGVDLWESMYDEKLSYSMSSLERGTGLAKFLYEDLSSGKNLNIKS